MSVTQHGPACTLGESPVWDARIGRLWWVDINGWTVWSVDAAGDNAMGLSLSGRPGCIALTDDPEVLIVTIEQSVNRLRWRTGGIAELARLSGAAPTVRFNDGRVDAWGRLWTGTMHVPSAARLALGCLYRIDPDRRIHLIEEGVGVANGIAFSPDGTVMYFADTHLRMVWRYPLTGSAADPGPREVFLDCAAAGLPGLPDGACTDAHGHYWLACVYGGAVAQVDPTGRTVAVHEVPVRRPTCPAFGGPELTSLWVTAIGAAAAAEGDGPQEGRLIRWPGAGRGRPEHRCAIS